MQLFHKKIGDGYPLIILHGLFGQLDNWVTLGKKFGETFSVYLVDQRNHGHSFHSDEFNYDLMAGDLLRFMDENFIETAHIIGHSMGGKTAMTFAVKFEQRVNKLIVADIAPKYYPPHHHDIIKALMSVPLETIQTRNEALPYLKKLIPEESTIQFLLKNLYYSEKEKLSWRFNLTAIAKNIENVGHSIEEFHRFNGPTLFMKGEKSKYVIPEDETMIHTIFPKAKIDEVSGAGHWIHAEKPNEFYEKVMDFLS